MDVIDIARVCHGVNRAICEAFGDFSQVSWQGAKDWQRDSAVRGVQFKLDHPTATPEQQHEAWCRDKLAAGWTRGPIKDANTKQHPCLVGYKDLPPEQRLKDILFIAVVAALSGR